jgi:RNA polymerase sigma factor (sigma-70 family)
MSEEKLLLEKLRNNDPAAIEYVYVQYKKAFFGFIGKMELNKQDIEDIYQDAIIALIENLQRRKLEALMSSVKTYLFSIGKYMAIKRWHKKLPGSSETIPDLVFEEGQVDDVYDSMATVIENNFDRLGHNCREILSMFYYESLTLDEILQKSSYANKDVLKSKKSRCLKKLKELCKIVIHG